MPSRSSDGELRTAPTTGWSLTAGTKTGETRDSSRSAVVTTSAVSREASWLVCPSSRTSSPASDRTTPNVFSHYKIINKMRFEEEKYFRPYVPLYKRNSRERSTSDHQARSRSPLMHTTAAFNNQTPPQRRQQEAIATSPSPNRRNTTDKPIWDLLYEEGMEQRRNIEEKHRQKTAQLD